MRIQELELWTGLDRATIRYYEKEEMIRPHRTENGYRDYSEEDRQHLLKIKLLRQLGMPLSKIRALQQGSEDMDSALQSQILQLQQHQDTVQRSLDVCIRLKNDGVSYESMDAVFYLEQFTKLSAAENAAKKADTPFREWVQRPYHPWKHLLGRVMDYIILLLLAVFVQLLFYRTDAYPWIVKFLKIPVILMLLPLEALCYKLFGTTPGKYLFGIHVLHADGCRHTLRSGLSRAFGAWRYGWGFGIPFYRIWRLWNSFRNYEFDENEWNRDSEVIYKPCGWRQTVAWVLVSVLLLGCIGGFVYHYDRALNYGRPITIQEFSENFNDYSRRSGTSGWIQMDEQGRFVQKINGDAIIITGRLDPKVPDLKYHTKDGLLTGFSCVDAFTYRSQEKILPERYQIAMISLLVSGEGEHGKGVDGFLKDFKQALQMQIAAGEYKLIYETDHAVVSWEMTAKGEFVIGYSGGTPVIVHQGDGDGFVTVNISVTMKNQIRNDE